MATRFTSFAQIGQRISQMSAEFQEEVKGIVEYNTGEIEIKAKAAAPTGGSRIRTIDGSISANQIAEKRLGSVGGNIAGAITYHVDSTGFIGTVVLDKSAGDLAIYVEVGTGQDAASYLAGLPPEWRAMAIRFFVNGKGRIIHQPYMYPAFMSQKLQFVKELKAALKALKL